MLWTDFQPFVMPYVVGCPTPILVHHARLVSIDWCRKTLAYTVDLDPVLTDGTETVEMEPESKTQIVKVMTVAVAGKDWELVEPRRGQQFVRSQHPGDFCFTRDNRSLAVYGVQPAGTEVVVTAALMPDMLRGTGLSDDLASQYADDIAKGIIASIMRLPAFADPGGAVMHQAMYESRRTTIAAKISRGLAAAKLRNPVSFI